MGKVVEYISGIVANKRAVMRHNEISSVNIRILFFQPRWIVDETIQHGILNVI